MAQLVSDLSERCAALDGMAGMSMSKPVRRDGAINTGGAREFLHDLPCLMPIDDEEGSRIFRAVSQALKIGPERAGDINLPVSFAFAGNPHTTPAVIGRHESRPGQREDLRDTARRDVEQADKQGIVWTRFCRLDHCEYLIFRQAALLEFRLGARPLDKFRRVFRDDLAGLEELEERANGGQLLRL